VAVTDPVTLVTTNVLDPEPAVAVALLDDTMNGGSGNDVLYGGGGWDSLNGDSGHDILVPGVGGVAQGGREVMDGGQGDDVYLIEHADWFVHHDIQDSGLTPEQLVNKGAGWRQGNGLGIDTVVFNQTTAADIVIAGTNVLGVASLFTGIERIIIGTTTLTGLALATGVNRDPQITINRNDTTLINVDASLANPGINVGLEIWGNAASNTIVGTAFNDVLDGGAGADILEGGVGDDTYIIDTLADVITEGLIGGGRDTVVVDGNFNYTLGVDFENLTLRNNNAQQGTGNALDNVIIGNNAANTLRGLEGNDTIDGGAGNDTIVGGAGVDTMTGGAGNDTFVFASVEEIGNDQFLRETITDFRTAGTDLLDFTAIDADANTAGQQAFSFIGSSAFSAAGQLRYENGVLMGDTTGDGVADFQLVLTGAPTLAADHFVSLPTVSIARSGNLPVAGLFEGNNGATTTHAFTLTLSRALPTAVTVSWAVTGTGTSPASAADFANGNFPSGTATIAAGQTTATVNVQVRGDTAVETDETFQVTLSNTTGGAALGTATATSIIRNDEGILNGTNGGNTINGGTGADTIFGNGGNDTLNGNQGNDIIDGGTGNDVITGGSGSDTLFGGTGSDSFRFNSLTGFDTIMDFNPAQDTLVFSRTTFQGLGNNTAINAGLIVFTSGAATDMTTATTNVNQRFVYNNTTGELWYDAGGNGGAAAVKIGVITTDGTTAAALTAADFTGANIANQV
jgi:Ca2+-binding RTX toxin-like protein